MKTAPTKILRWFISPFVVPSFTYPLSYLKTHSDNFLNLEASSIRSLRPNNVFDLSHEMAHLIEIEDSRAYKWGFSYSRGPFGHLEPTTDQAVQREIRTFAIQAKILEHFRFFPDFNYMGVLINCGALADDFLWRKRLGLPYEKHSETSDLVVETASVIQSLSETWKIEDIWSEWKRKLVLVEKQVKRSIDK